MIKRLYATALFVAMVPFISDGQSKTAEHQTRDVHDSFGERLGTMIEEFINDVGMEFSGIHEEQDTLPRPRKDRQKNEDYSVRSRQSLTYDGNKVIEESETIDGNVVVKAGDLTVYGTITGDALVVGGTLYVKNGGRVTGNARVINGDIVKEDQGFVGGYMDKTSAATTGYREDRSRFTRSSYRLNADWVDEMATLDNFVFRYNRVEGVFIGLGSEKKYYWDGYRNYAVYGSLGWGFKSHRWRYHLGVARQFRLSTSGNQAQILEAGVEGHSFTDSKDNWIIGVHENTAAAFLIHEDYRDYFGREGLAIQTGYYTQKDDFTGQLKVSYNIDQYTSLVNRTEWSLFGGHKVFRPNPAIHDGPMRSIVITGGLSSISRTSRGQHGWSVYGTAEYARKSLGGIFGFSHLTVDLRRYQPLGYHDAVNLRVRVGTAAGNLPLQKTFELGGLSTLHARPYKEDMGNRMILFNAEYIVNGDFLHDLDFWPSSLMRGLNFLVMTDAGLVRSVSPERSWEKGFERISFSDFKNDVGLGFASRGGTLRVALVWRTDVKAPGKFIFRFTRPF